MKVIVGLGNPGTRYVGTRHNVGFAVVDWLAQAPGTSRPLGRFNAEIRERLEEETKILLVKPQSFMNLSGRTVHEVVSFYQLPTEELLVICDDFNLPLGKLRFRSKGSEGGHNGLRDIINHLGTMAFPRLRLGVGPPEKGQAIDYVLGRFRPSEKPGIEDAIARAGQAASLWVHRGIQECMNQYNG
jgi:peptidyl-tRNA hydrolase, PTH1 family